MSAIGNKGGAGSVAMANGKISFVINTNDLNDDETTTVKIQRSALRSSSFKEDVTINDAVLAEEEDSTISITSSSSSYTTNPAVTSAANHNNVNNGNSESVLYKKQLEETTTAYNQLRTENKNLHEEIECLRHEMEELQDQFRLDDADEFRQLQAELEIATKNCRILQFKLRKLEKRNDTLETEKLLLHDKLDDYSHEIEKVRNLEEELLVAKEVSIRLHSELEQAEVIRKKNEKLNKDLKFKLDELKDEIDAEMKKTEINEDNNQIVVLINKLYESMFREYFLEEQLSNISTTQQTQHETKQLREVTDLLNSYQQKISLFNDEITILKQELSNKDKETEQLRLQLKNLKRSRSSDNSMHHHNSRNAASGGKQRSHSADTSDSRQIDSAHDEIHLLKNKISRLEDDLLFVTQERDCLVVQLDKIEQKAMKSFTMVDDDNNIVEHDVDDIDLDSIVAKQMLDLKQKLDNLNKEYKENESRNLKLVDEINQLKAKLNVKNEVEESRSAQSISEQQLKNLTDNDKLIRDECKQLKLDLGVKNDEIAKMEKEIKELKLNVSEYKIQISLKDNQIDKVKLELGNDYNTKLNEVNSKLDKVTIKCEQEELENKRLKVDLELRLKQELGLKENFDRLNAKHDTLNEQLSEKLKEIERLTRENKAFIDRLSMGDKRIHIANSELENYKNKIDNLNSQLEMKLNEILKLDQGLKFKENELHSLNLKLNIKELDIKHKLDECENHRSELDNLQVRYTKMSTDLDAKVDELNKEIERLIRDKEKLSLDLQELRAKHSLDAHFEQQSNTGMSAAMHSNNLKNIELIATKTKFEAKMSVYELENSNLKAKIAKMLREKEIQEQVLKENQRLSKDIANKYSIDSEAWSRQRQQFLEKENLYQESIEVKKELKMAADRLRQKLQSIEDQMTDKENKHTIEKFNWDTQKLQLVSTINRLEEQLSKAKAIKKTKKETELSWDKERKDLHHSVQSMQIFIKDLQSQLMQRDLNKTANSSLDNYYNNETLQSLQGENEFLKNRIKELEIMLDELEQVKRFLFDLKEAYDAERAEWLNAKVDFHNQIEMREKIWNECNTKLNQILGEISELKTGITETEVFNDKTAALNNLCGGTSNLIDFLHNTTNQHHDHSNHQLHDNPAAANSNAAANNLYHCEKSIYENTEKLSGFEYEFNQLCKKIDRVKENFATHKKFMDIVKSKSSKTLNRKSSISSLPLNEMYQVNLPANSRGSVPPDQRIMVNIPQRAKSVTKDASYENSNSNPSGLNHPSISSRFFSLGRKFSRLRFNSAAPPVSTTATSIERQPSVEPQRVVQSSNDKTVKKPARERALSPTKLFRNLRPRSPFSRARSSSSKSTAAEEANKTTAAMTSTPSTPVIASTPANGGSALMTMSCYSSIEPSEMRTQSYTHQMNEHRPLAEKLRSSLSCEFIDNPSNDLNKDTDGNETKAPFTRVIATQRIKKLNIGGFNTIKNEPLLENLNESVISNTHVVTTTTTPIMTQTISTNEIVKSVKFKEPLEMDHHSSNENIQQKAQSSQQQQQTAARSKAEEQLMNALDETLFSVDSRASPSLSNSTNDDEVIQQQQTQKRFRLNNIYRHANNFQELKAAFSATSVDKPPKPPSIFSFGSNSNSAAGNSTTPRSKFAQNKSRTIDFPDLLQSAIDSTSQSSTANKPPTTSASTNFIPGSTTARPIHSILRRSETPPSTKSATSATAAAAATSTTTTGPVVRQTSIESNESSNLSRDLRETSLEKRLRISSSTSRPLMFNN